YPLPKTAGRIQRGGVEGSRKDCGRTIFSRHGCEIARADLSRHRQNGEIDREREKISAVPRSLSALHHEWLRFVARADFVVANDLEKIAVMKMSILRETWRDFPSGDPAKWQVGNLPQP